jgi:hypothetical protein
LQKVDEFTVPGNLVFDDVKERIRFWLKTGVGNEYQFRLITEEDVSVTRTKHDFRVCVIPCIVTPLVVALMIASIAIIMISPQNSLMVMFGFIAVIMISYVAAIGYFCLKPQEVTFELRFSRGVPITITVGGEGEIIRARGDYESLKKMILRTDFDQLPKPDAW